ncbi:MAG: hypothetical protein OXH00_00665 [Candidatus Poribacteria bacterium]|nr:hypothetical protein [Candidatus Poribacteria bacterium]
MRMKRTRTYVILGMALLLSMSLLTKKIAPAKHQYSGNAQKVVNGIGVVTCLYVNPMFLRHDEGVAVAGRLNTFTVRLNS